MQIPTAITHALASASTLGLDSFVGGLACAPWVTSSRRRVALAAAFGASDAIAAAVGAALVGRAGALGAGAIWAACALAVAAVLRGRRALLFAAPLLLGLDDLVAGEAARAAPLLGLASALLALAGCSLGAAAWRAVRRGGSPA